jgi:hypothetical protein
MAHVSTLYRRANTSKRSPGVYRLSILMTRDAVLFVTLHTINTPLLKRGALLYLTLFNTVHKPLTPSVWLHSVCAAV